MEDERSDLFQFHTGSIKSCCIFSWLISHFLFQFHTGSIKREFGRTIEVTDVKFQFHTGSIKSEKGWYLHEKNARFNSILVRLKVTDGTEAERIETVSIPYWFD